MLTCHLLLTHQALLLLPMMILLAIYAFIKPYKMFHINLLESVVLADTLYLLLIASTDNFKVISLYKYSIYMYRYCIVQFLMEGNIDEGKY